MGVVEEDFAEKNAGKDIEDNLVEWREIGVEAIRWFAASEAAERE